MPSNLMVALKVSYFSTLAQIYTGRHLLLRMSAAVRLAISVAKSFHSFGLPACKTLASSALLSVLFAP